MPDHRLVGIGMSSFYCSSSRTNIHVTILKLSDRYGRTRILGIAIVGLLMEDVAILVVGGLSPVMRLPFGYWTVLFGPIISGMVGGSYEIDYLHKSIRV